MNRSDTFDRADTSSAIGTPSDAGSAWSQISGTWGIASNLAYESSTQTQAICVLESSEANGDVQATASVISNCGIVARVSDDSNYILMEVQVNQVRVFKKVAGSFTQLGSTYSGTVSNGDVLKLSVDGSNNIIAHTNGTARVTTSDSHNSTATQHGIRSHLDTSNRLNDFSFTGAGAATGNPWYYYAQQG